MLRGFTTISYFADDVAAAARWYAELLGVQPYMETAGPTGAPAYVEFRFGDYQHELGIIDSRFASHEVGRPAGVVMYWAVDDVPKALERLVELGATIEDEPVDRGTGYITATVVDPFGNVLGVMYNPHYLEVLARFQDLS